MSFRQFTKTILVFLFTTAVFVPVGDTLAGVTARVRSNRLELTGDSACDERVKLHVDYRRNQLVVDTTIGRSKSTARYPVAAGLKIDLRGGKDQVELSGPFHVGDISIVAESVILVDATIFGNLDVRTYPYDPELALIFLADNSYIFGDTFVWGTDHNDFLRIRESSFFGYCQIDLADGDDDVYLFAEVGDIEFDDLLLSCGDGMDVIFYEIHEGYQIIDHGRAQNYSAYGGYYWETTGNFVINLNPPMTMQLSLIGFDN